MTTNTNMVETLATLIEMDISENLSSRADFEGVKIDTVLTAKVDGHLHEVSKVVTLNDGQKLRVTVEVI